MSDSTPTPNPVSLRAALRKLAADVWGALRELAFITLVVVGVAVVIVVPTVIGVHHAESPQAQAHAEHAEQEAAARDAAKHAADTFKHTCIITATAQKLCGTEAAAWCQLTQPLRDQGTGESVETSDEACHTVTP